MSDPAANVTIKLTHEFDEDGEYGAFTNVEADIMLHTTNKIGYIQGTIVDRQRIPDGSFLEAMDGHSADMQHVGVVVYEPRYGRTKLTSLADADDPEFDMLYIAKFHVDDEYKQDGASDVGATALRQFLHHPFIKGNLKYGCWKVSSAVYILDAQEAMTKKEREEHEAKRDREREEDIQRRMRVTEAPPETTESLERKKQDAKKWEAFQRADANQFLRNGFFQDEAVAKSGNPSFLVASYGNWDREQLLTHEQAKAIRFYEPAEEPPPTPTGKDSELLQLVMRHCGEAQVRAYSGRPTGQQADEQSELRNLETKIRTLIQQGASLMRSNALHAAVANNTPSVVLLLLRMDRDLLNSKDVNYCTPLMVAAESAAGRGNKDGIQDTQVLDFLLAAGADLSIQDQDGMTAYGHYEKKTKDYNVMLRAMIGSSFPSMFGDRGEASRQAVSRKLMPQGGPSEADRTGGQTSGFVQFSDEGNSMNDGDY